MSKFITWSCIIGIVALISAIGAYSAAFYAASQHSPSPIVSATPVIEMPTSSEVEAEVNNFRQAQGLSPIFSDSAVLDTAAQARAEQMCADNDWSHDKAWTVLDPLYSYSHASENLYYDYLRENQAISAVKTWSESPGHLENILKDHAEMGIGVKSCPGFQGYDTAVIITNYFGVPR